MEESLLRIEWPRKPKNMNDPCHLSSWPSKRNIYLSILTLENKRK
jgi:hypothetical protein